MSIRLRASNINRMIHPVWQSILDLAFAFLRAPFPFNLFVIAVPVAVSSVLGALTIRAIRARGTRPKDPLGGLALIGLTLLIGLGAIPAFAIALAFLFMLLTAFTFTG